MRIAVVGKGGAGKTTVAATLARTLARGGRSVIALDGDTNANLGISLGLGVDTTDALVSLREQLDTGETEHARDLHELLLRFGAEAPDGVRLGVPLRIENAQPGCPCCGISVEQLLGSVPTGDHLVIADLEAGIGTMTRLQAGSLEAVLVVTEPTATSIDVGARAAALAADKGVPQVLIVANRIGEPGDLDRVRAGLGAVEGVRHDVVEVPDDPAIRAADREGVAPLDHAPDSPGVRALIGLADRVAGVPA